MNHVAFKTTIEGEYKIVVKNTSTGVETESDWFSNLITDQGLDRLGYSGPTGEFNPYFKYCRVGTGTGIPYNSQQDLEAQIAASTPNSANNTGNALSAVSEGAPNWGSLLTFGFPFAQGAVVGNISEVGVAWTATGPTLFSRALIVDGANQPTTITVTAIDQLTVYYRVRILPPLSDSIGTVVLAGTTHTYTSRFSQVQNPADIRTLAGHQHFLNPNTFNAVNNTYPPGTALGDIYGTPGTGGLYGGATGAKGTAGAYVYAQGSLYSDSVWTWNTGQGNSGGIQVIKMHWGDSQAFRFQIHFDPPIPKDNTKVLSLTMRFSWGRP